MVYSCLLAPRKCLVAQRGSLLPSACSTNKTRSLWDVATRSSFLPIPFGLPRTVSAMSPTCFGVAICGIWASTVSSSTLSSMRGWFASPLTPKVTEQVQVALGHWDSLDPFDPACWQAGSSITNPPNLPGGFAYQIIFLVLFTP